MLEFSKISKGVFSNSEYDIKNGRRISIYKAIEDSKVILVLDYLYRKVNRDGDIALSINDIVETLGFEPNYHKDKINDKIMDILRKLQEQDVIAGVPEKINAKDFLKLSIEKMFYKNGAGEDSFYVTLNTEERDKVLNYNETKLDTSKLLLYYLYIKSKIHFKSKENDWKVETCWFSLEQVTEDIASSKTTLMKYNTILMELGLIRFESAGCYRNREGNIRKAHNIYTLDLYSTDNDNDAETRLKYAIAEYKTYYKRFEDNQKKGMDGFTDDLFG